MLVFLSLLVTCYSQLTHEFNLYTPEWRSDVNQLMVMPNMHVESLLAAKNQSSLEKSMDFAQVHDVNQDILDGSAYTIGADTLYVSEFIMKNAESMAFYFESFHLPEGCGMYIVTPDEAIGAFTHENRWSEGNLQTRHVQGSKLQIQLYCSATIEEAPLVKLAKIATAYLKLGASAGTCNIQAQCIDPSNSCNDRCHPADRSCSIQCTRYEGVGSNSQWAGSDWEAQRRSTVAVMSAWGSRYCSGNFINNANGEQLVLTAAHCTVSSSDLLLHGFMDSSCTSNSNSNGDTSRSVGDLSTLASNTQVDNTLLRVGARIPSSWNVFLAGYDTTSTAPNAVVCISHPASSNMKISHSNRAITQSSYSGWGTADHWRVTEWSEATTEGGSSGSALFDQRTKRIIGQLHGGTAMCPAFNGYDSYGGLFASISQSSMRQYLVASNMDGRNL